jgi:flagellar basal body P-ring formation protein FlgA
VKKSLPNRNRWLHRAAWVAPWALGLFAATAHAGEAAAWAQQARSLVEQAAAQALPGARLELEVGALDARLQLAPCQKVQAYLPANARAWGRTRVGLRCLEGTKPWNVYLPVTVKVFAPALVLKHALPAGTALNESHLHLATVDWAAANEPPVNHFEPLRGRSLGQALAAGTAVRGSDLKTRLWFAAGDLVQVVARGPGFSVSATAQALAAGLEGTRVRVRTDGGQVLTGVAVGQQRVEVEL